MGAHARRLRRKLRRRMHHALLVAFGAPVIDLLSRSWRVETLGEEWREASERAPGRLWALWHGRMLLGLVHHRGRGFNVLVSPSGDGDMVETLIPRFGYRVVRGSSSRGGARAVREMLRELERGGTVVVTPDGPRGPRMSMNTGLAWLARATGFPILPIGFGCDRAWRLRSWDEFTIPRRGARVVMAYGEPVTVERGGGEDALLAATRTLRERMIAAERSAFARVGAASDWERSCEDAAWQQE